MTDRTEPSNVKTMFPIIAIVMMCLYTARKLPALFASIRLRYFPIANRCIQSIPNLAFLRGQNSLLLTPHGADSSGMRIVMFVSEFFTIVFYIFSSIFTHSFGILFRPFPRTLIRTMLAAIAPSIDLFLILRKFINRLKYFAGVTTAGDTIGVRQGVLLDRTLSCGLCVLANAGAFILAEGRL